MTAQIHAFIIAKHCSVGRFRWGRMCVFASGDCVSWSMARSRSSNVHGLRGLTPHVCTNDLPLSPQAGSWVLMASASR